MKVCKKCLQLKPLSEYHKNKTEKDGLCCICKPCNCAHAKTYRDKDPRRTKEQKRQSYLKNHEKRLKQMREYRLKNLDAVRERDRKRGRLRSQDQTRANYLRDPERAKLRAANWKASNPERAKEIRREWRQRNKATVNFWDARRRANEKNATPKWANQFFIAEAYRLAKLREKVCGGKWHVDHVVPIQSKLVCGLHVDNNLSVIPGADNMRKSNRRWPDMP